MSKWVGTEFICPICEGSKLISFKKPTHLTPSFVQIECDSCDSEFSLWIKLKKGQKGNISTDIELHNLSPKAAILIKNKDEMKKAGVSKSDMEKPRH